MPWCDSCDEYRAPTALVDGKTCSTCDNVVDTEDLKLEMKSGPPWHFWLMIVAVAAYIGWRAIEGVMWLIAQL